MELAMSCVLTFFVGLKCHLCPTSTIPPSTVAIIICDLVLTISLSLQFIDTILCVFLKIRNISLSSPNRYNRYLLRVGEEGGLLERGLNNGQN